MQTHRWKPAERSPAALAACGSSVRASIDATLEPADQDTADLFIDVSRAIDKCLWLVEAHGQE